MKGQRGEVEAKEGKTPIEKDRGTEKGTQTQAGAYPQRRRKGARPREPQTRKAGEVGVARCGAHGEQGLPPSTSGEVTPARRCEPRGARARRTDRWTKPGRARARPGRGRCLRGPGRSGEGGAGKRREGEGSGGAGRARGAGRKRGGAAGRGPPEKRPDFLPRQSQEAGAGTQGPGLPSPTSGAPPVTSARTPGTRSPAPPGFLPSAAGGSGVEEGGAGALPPAEGPPSDPTEPAAAPPRASVFPSVKGSKEGRTHT